MGTRPSVMYKVGLIVLAIYIAGINAQNSNNGGLCLSEGDKMKLCFGGTGLDMKYKQAMAKCKFDVAVKAASKTCPKLKTYKALTTKVSKAGVCVLKMLKFLDNKGKVDAAAIGMIASMMPSEVTKIIKKFAAQMPKCINNYVKTFKKNTVNKKKCKYGKKDRKNLQKAISYYKATVAPSLCASNMVGPVCDEGAKLVLQALISAMAQMNSGPTIG